MSKQIDQKVVEMQFDNAKFEKNIQTSMSSLDKLKEKLNFNGVSTGLEDVNTSSRNAASGMSGLAAGVETTSSKFSAMEVIAFTALQNITNSAIEAGKRIVASLSIDQVTSGFAKYEEKTTAVQTIMNATGKSIDEVNEQLEKLNWFTDETSYSFTDMVSNIGKFTSNGVDLGVSVTAMMGIANWAALSGQNAEAAGRAMYNLSQSIGMGAVKLQDWKSIENANMATKEFKEIAIETAKALGVLNENAETESGIAVGAENFSSTLSEGWFTSEVLLAALDKYGNYSEEVYKVATEQGLTAADAMKIVSSETMELGSKAFKAAQEAKTFTDALNATKDAVSSGWMATFETIFGNYEEAKVLWTDVANELYDIFASGAESRNELLGEWKELGGRDLMIEALMNSLTILKNVIEAVSTAFHDIFPAKTADDFVSMTQSVKDFTERLKNNEGLLNNFTRILRGLFAVLDIGKQLISSVFRVLDPFLSKIPALSGGVLDLAGSFGDFLVNLDDSIKKSDFFYNIFTKIAEVIGKVVSALREFIAKVKETEVFAKISELLSKAIGKIKEFIAAAKEKFSTPGFDLFHTLLEKLHNALTVVFNIIGKVVSAIINAFKSVAQAITGSSLLQVLSKVWEIIVAIGKCIFGLLGEAISSLCEKLKDADFKGILDFLTTLSVGGMAAGIAKFFNSISAPFEGIKDIVKGISGILDSVRGCFEAYQNKLKADTLMKIASAIAILTASLLVLSFIDNDKLMQGISGITMLFAELLLSMKLFTSFSGKSKKATSTTTMMIGMSLAVLVLASALKKLSSLDSEALGRGLVGLTGLLAIMIASTKMIGKDGKKVMKGAFQLILFGVAIKILASACTKLSKLSWGELSKGLVGVGVLMAEIAVFLRVAKFNKKAISTALGMILLASAIKILAKACVIFADLSWSGIAKGLGSIGVLLAELVLFTKLIGQPKRLISTGLGLIGVATAMKIFASAMTSFAKLSWGDTAKGLLAIAGCLAAVTVALNFLPKGMISKGLGLIAVATALTILAAALNKMGSMSWSGVAKGLLSLGGSLAILAVGLRAMKKCLSGAAALLVASMALAVLAPVLALLGAMSWEAILKGLVALAGAFVILGVAGAVLGPLTPAILAISGALALCGVAVLAAGVGLTAAGVGLSALAVAFTAFATALSVGATAIVAGLTVIISGIVQLIPTVATMIANGLIEFAKVIGEGAPIIAEAVKSVVLNLLDILVTCVPQIVEVIFILLESVLATLVEHAPTIVQAVFDILIACLEGIANNISMVVQTAIDIVINFIEGIAQKLPDVIQAGFDLIISFINGITDALNKNTKPLIEAMGNLFKAVLNSIWEVFKGAGTLLYDVGKNIIQGLINGIKNAAEALWDVVCDVGNSIKDWFCNLFGINSPSKVFAEYGMYMDEGLAVGLYKYSDRVEDATEKVGENAIDTMSDAISQVSDVIENGEFGDPTIRPVMDLSQIQNGTAMLSKMMSDADDYKMSASVNLANQAAKGMSRSQVDDDSTSLDSLAKSIQKMADNPSQNVSNVFNITGDDPQEIAERVSDIIQKQIVRKGATWE